MCSGLAGEPGLTAIKVQMAADGEQPAHFTMAVAPLKATCWPDALHPIDLTIQPSAFGLPACLLQGTAPSAAP